MDPAACLKAVAEAIVDDDQGMADDLLDNYVNWRGIGGSNPDLFVDSIGFIRGDDFFDVLLQRYRSKFDAYCGATL